MLKITTRKNLKRTSLIISLIGILAIILLSIYSEPKPIFIKDLEKKDIDNYVKLNGTVIDIEKMTSDNYLFYILRLKDNSGSIDVIYSKDNNLNLNQKVQIIGKVSEYKNALQIESKKIKVLS